MAKIEGTQNVPSELLDLYRGTLGEATPKSSIAKRYPYRVPPMQTEAGHPSIKQLKQRERFKTAINNFAGLDATARARWYESEPPWGSFLWYYNYFIMSSLVGNADIPAGGAGVIKSIQFKTMAIPEGTGEGQAVIDAIDPEKSVVMLYGGSVAPIATDIGNLYVSVYPYVSSIAAELVKCKWSLSNVGWGNTKAANIGITVIEYI